MVWGVTGINSSVALVPLQAHYAGNYLSTEAIAKCVLRAHLLDIDIINCSFGSTNLDPVLYRAMQVYQGLIVCAAGNNGRNMDEGGATYPACFDLNNIITVANTTAVDQLATSSNYGAMAVDLAAPGTNIYSTIPDGYGIKSGTSMAAPFVAGTAALLLSYNPNLTATDLKSIILGSVDPIEALDGKVASGGRLNVYNALQNTLEGDYKRNVTSMVSFPTASVNMMKVKISYDAQKYTFHSIVFDDAISANVDYDISILGEVNVNIVFAEDTIISGDLIRCNFDTLQKFAVTDADISVVLEEAKNAGGQTIEIAPDFQFVLLADMDLNNSIDSTDLDAAYSIVRGESIGTDAQCFIADVDCDGDCTTGDIIKIMKYINGTAYSFW